MNDVGTQAKRYFSWYLMDNPREKQFWNQSRNFDVTDITYLKSKLTFYVSDIKHPQYVDSLKENEPSTSSYQILHKLLQFSKNVLRVFLLCLAVLLKKKYVILSESSG